MWHLHDEDDETTTNDERPTTKGSCIERRGRVWKGREKRACERGGQTGFCANGRKKRDRQRSERDRVGLICFWSRCPGGCMYVWEIRRSLSPKLRAKGHKRRRRRERRSSPIGVHTYMSSS